MGCRTVPFVCVILTARKMFLSKEKGTFRTYLFFLVLVTRHFGGTLKGFFEATMDTKECIIPTTVVRATVFSARKKV